MKRKLSILLVICLLLQTQPVVGATFENYVADGVVSDNVHTNNYGIYANSNWGHTVKSYVDVDDSGNYNRVEYIDEQIVSEIYSKDFSLLQSNTTALELPRYGGVYISDDGYFVVEGQNNPDEFSDVTEYRVIKYDKSWNKVASDDLKNANTAYPFDAGSCRFSEIDGKLYIRTCHEMYKTEDGYNHQASIMIKVNMADCTIEDSEYVISNNKKGYVSHSFNQYLDEENGVLYACDQGDAYPRSMVVLKYTDSSMLHSAVAANVFDFSGEAGANYTGAELGGFAVSSGTAIVAGCSIPQDEPYSNNRVKNIFISTVPVDSNEFSSQYAKTIWLTDYSQDQTTSACNPQLVELGNGRLMILWEEKTVYTRDFLSTKYAILDSNGNVEGQIKEIYANLSDCQPVVDNDYVVWYTTGENDCSGSTAPTFYKLPVSGDFESLNTKPEIGDEITRGDFTFKVTSVSDVRVTVELISFNGTGTECVVPGTFTANNNLYNVTSIAKGAIKDKDNLQYITFPAEIENFEEGCVAGKCTIAGITNNSNISYVLPMDIQYINGTDTYIVDKWMIAYEADSTCTSISGGQMAKVIYKKYIAPSFTPVPSDMPVSSFTPVPSVTEIPDGNDEDDDDIEGNDETDSDDKGDSSTENMTKTPPSVAKVKSFKVKTGVKKLTVSWKKVSKASGYQLQYSKKSNFNKAKKVTLSPSKTKYVIKKLGKKTKYYVRIRAYKKYKNSNGKTQNAYGSWSRTSIKTK